MSEENNQDLPEEEEIEKEEEEEYEGRDWGKLFLGILFIFVAVIVWYVVSALT